VESDKEDEFEDDLKLKLGDGHNIGKSIPTEMSVSLSESESLHKLEIEGKMYGLNIIII